MPITEKKLAYYRLSSQVLLHPKLGFLDLLGLKKVLRLFGLKTAIFQNLKIFQNQDLKKWS